MKKLISALKQIQISRILAIFFVGLLVFVGTAFSSDLQASAQTGGEEVPETGATSPLEGGMNKFPDVDPRLDTSEADAKAGSLIESAEQNTSKDYELASPPLGANPVKTTENAGEAAKGAVEDAASGTQQGIQNIKENTQKAARGFFKGG